MLTVWWLRPDRSAARVGEHNAVVWKRLKRSPAAASRSAFGVSHGPPNALDAPNPVSSIRTMRTFGAPSGGRSGSMGGNAVSGSLASYVVRPTYSLGGMGRIVRGNSSRASEVITRHFRTERHGTAILANRRIAGITPSR
jgi:hypothetical protein